MPGKTKSPSLEWCVLATLAWFAVLKRPLTVAELSRLLLKRKANQRQIADCLAKLGSRVRERDGFWTVAGARVRYPDTESDKWFRYKWWRLGLAVKVLKWVPYVRLVAAANTVADGTATKDSDIDVFIVIKHGRLYLSRLIITALLQLTGLRRHGQHIANRICLSFFTTDAGMDLKGIAFEPYDIYLAYWVAELRPVLSGGKVESELLDANHWVSDFIPHYREGPSATQHPGLMARFGERVFDTYLGDKLEQRLAAWQQSRIRANQERSDSDVLIVATDRMLKFHEKERRKVYRDQWERLMRQLGENPRRILD
jgi:hypothetical protein